MGLGIATAYSSIGVGTCYGHESPIPMSGIIINGANTVFCNGLPVGQMTSIVLGDDGHTGIIVSSSGTVSANGLGVAYITSSFVGTFTGVIVGGSGNVTSGL